jgi:hypothetical protein
MVSQWWVRPRKDGGCDYVRLRSSSSHGNLQYEWIEGSHLPPQMPLLKRRRWLSAEMLKFQKHELEAHGYHPSQPVF